MEALSASAPLTLNIGIIGGLIFTAAVAIFAPLIAATVVVRQTGAPLRILGWGALVFFVSQLVLRVWWVGLLQAALKDTLAASRAAEYGFLLFLSATAGLFEETGRYVGYRYLVKERSWRSGVLFGVGHGGIESIVLVGLSVMSSTVMYVMIAQGRPLPLPPEQLAQMTEAFADLTPLKAMLGGIERLGALCFHVALSLVVMRAIVRGDRRWLGWSILLHTLFNFVAVSLMKIAGPFAAEAAVLAGAALSVWFIRRERASEVAAPAP